MKKLLVKNIGLLATPEGKSAHRGEEQGKIKFLKDAWVLIEDGITYLCIRLNSFNLCNN